MVDYPDYTSLTQIIGVSVTVPIEIEACDVTLDFNLTAADIMMPCDLQGAYIMMPVDIQAQYVDIDVDIVAQTVGDITVDINAQSIGNISVNLAASAITLSVNLAASAITLNVDVTAQTIGNLTIDITAQTVAVYNPPEWSGKQGISVDLTGVVAAIDPTTETLIATRNVTAGKTWVVHAFTVMVYEDSGNVAGYIWNDTDNVAVAAGGGTQGFLVTLPKPVRLAAGKNIDLLAIHHAVGVASIYGCIYGYEE